MGMNYDFNFYVTSALKAGLEYKSRNRGLFLDIFSPATVVYTSQQLSVQVWRNRYVIISQAWLPEIYLDFSSINLALKTKYCVFVLECVLSLLSKSRFIKWKKERKILIEHLKNILNLKTISLNYFLSK